MTLYTSVVVVVDDDESKQRLNLCNSTFSSSPPGDVKNFLETRFHKEISHKTHTHLDGVYGIVSVCGSAITIVIWVCCCSG